MAKQKIRKNMSYEQLEEDLLVKVHAYRTLQVNFEVNGYDTSFHFKINSAAFQVEKQLEFMQEGEPGSLEQLAREQRQQEREFKKEIKRLEGFVSLQQRKYTQAILQKVDAKLDDMGMPVIKPGSYD